MTYREPMYCNNCLFWEPKGEALEGWCHRYPPSVLSECKTEQVHVVVSCDDWCGEWKEGIE